MIRTIRVYPFEEDNGIMAFRTTLVGEVPLNLRSDDLALTSNNLVLVDDGLGCEPLMDAGVTVRALHVQLTVGLLRLLVTRRLRGARVVKSL